MKKLSITLTLLILTGTVFAQSGEKKGSFEPELLSELQVLIDAGMEITVRPGTSGSIQYEYSFDGNEQAYEHYFQNFDPEFESRGGESRLVINFPQQKRNNVNFVIDKHELSLLVPSTVLINLTTRYSTVDIEGFQQGLHIENRSGLVVVNDIDQMVSISNAYGAVKATNIRGELQIANRSANVDVKEVRGPVRVNAEYSKLNISQIEGDLIVSNRSGVMNAFEIQGDIDASGPYMEYELTNIDGDIRMSNKSGKVVVDNARSLIVNGDYTPITATSINSAQGVDIQGRSADIRLKNISGNTIINGQYLNTDLNNIDGSFRMQNRSGTINATDISGELLIQGEYLDINIEKFKGSNIEVVNRSNDVEIEALNELTSVFIENEYGKIFLQMKAVFNGAVQIETRYGEYISDFELDDQQLIKGQNELSVSGTLGSGSGRMMLKNKNGDVRVNRN